MTDERRRYVRRLLLLGAALPLAISVTGAGIAISWLGRLPAEVAIHWGPGDTGPDGFASPWLIPGMLLLITAGFSAVTVFSLSGASGTNARNARLLLATASWLSTTLTVGLVGSLVPQLDLTDVRSVGSPVAPLVAGAALGLVIGTAAWFLAPRPPEDEGETPAVEPVRLGEGARVFWTATASASPKLAVVLALFAVALLIQAIVLTLELGNRAWPIYIAPLVLGLVLSTLTWRVRIDHRGVVARSLLGFPRIIVPADRIDGARVVTVSPVADFGGWGLRWIPGQVGVILRGGEALQISQRGGLTVTITTRDAGRAAGIVDAIAAQPQR
jgi:hypothetical protein